LLEHANVYDVDVSALPLFPISKDATGPSL